MGGNSGDGLIAVRLQELLLGSDTMDVFLNAFAVQAAEVLGLRAGMVCSVTLVRCRRGPLTAVSGVDAKDLDGIAFRGGGGPCLLAVRAGATTVVNDTAADDRWPDCLSAARERGYCGDGSAQEEAAGGPAEFRSRPERAGAGTRGFSRCTVTAAARGPCRPRGPRPPAGLGKLRKPYGIRTDPAG